MMVAPELVEDFTLAPVPDGDTVSGLKIMIVIVALGFTLPMFALGAQVTNGMGLVRGLVACLVGCWMAAVLSIGAAVVGSRLRVSTYVILTIVFGKTGGRMINMLLGIALLGWYANVADLLGSSVSDGLHTLYGVTLSPFACTGVALIFMTVTGIFGFRMMERFSTIIVPLLSAFMFYVLWRAFQSGALPVQSNGDGSLDMVHSVSAVLGFVILMAVLAPDFARYARNDLHALGVALAIGVGYPFIFTLGALPAAILSEHDIMKIMALLGVPGVGLVMLILSTWASNTGNLYCSTLTLATVLPRVPVWQLGIGGGLVALIAALFHVSVYFVPFLETIGVIAGPVAAVYICSYFGGDRAAGRGWERFSGVHPIANVFACLAGSLVGYASAVRGGFFMPVPSLEGFLISCVTWGLVRVTLQFRTARGTSSTRRNE